MSKRRPATTTVQGRFFVATQSLVDTLARAGHRYWVQVSRYHHQMFIVVRRSWRRRLGPVVAMSTYAVVILSIVFMSVRPALVVYADTTAYDFSVPGDYTLGDSSKIEIAGNTARLKSQQYVTDGNTAGLWHFDETEGGGAETAADDVSSNNNDGTFGTTNPCATDGGAFGAGKVNNAVTLPGTPNCLTVPDSASLSFSGVNPSMTAEALIRFPNAFDATADIRQSIFDKGNYRMFFSESDGKLKFELHGASSSKTWSKVGGANTSNITTTEGMNGSWRQYLPGTVQVIQEYNSALYIGTAGPTTSGGTAEVWKYTSGTSWTKVAGDGLLQDEWNNVNFESVQSMTVFNGLLYIGLGFSTNDGEVWAYNDSPESLVRARSFTNIEEVFALVADGTTALYAGLGNTASDADVWQCTTSCTTSGNWTQIGGNEVNATKPNWNTGYERVRSMVMHGGKLFVGLGDTAAEAEVWRYDTTSWTKVGGDGVGSTASWTAAGNFEYVSALASDGTNLYAGLGLSASDADVWACTANCTSGTPSWTQIGGDSANNWNANYDTVRGMVVVGTTLFASLGDTAGEAEVWRYSGSGNTWTKIAGDGVNATWDNSFSAAGTANVKEQAYLGVFGSDLVAGTGTTPQDAEVWRCTANCTSGTPTWSWIGGRDFSSWGPAQMSQVGTMTIHNGKLYVGFGITNKHAVLWQYDGSIWTQVGGGGIQGSDWEIYEFIRGSTTFNGKLYVGMGDTTTDADVWEWDGASWTKMGGDGVSGSWNTNYEYVANLVSDGTYMYAGLGSGAGDAEIYKYDPDGSPNKWSKIGGDTANNWSTTREHAWTMAVYGNSLFVGLGTTGTNGANPTCRANQDGEVWRYSGAGDTWTQIGGDGLNSSWDCSTTESKESVYSMTFVEDVLYVGLGNTADESTISDGEVWECTGCVNTGGTPSWTKVGGDNLNSGWNDTDYEWVSSMITYNGDLYAGLGNEAGDADLWRYYDHDNNTGTAKIWNKVGGDGVGTPASWSTNYETINGLTVYNGRLYAGLGNTNNTTTPSDGEIWEYGGNNVLVGKTSTNTWTANTWYHVAAVYNGTDLKMYVNGVQDGATVTGGVTMTDNTKTLTIGSLKGPLTSDGPYGGFSGELDELRISSNARDSSTFVQTQYVTTPQTVRLATALGRNQKQNWNGFDATETTNGGTIGYRLSGDSGSTWKYWDGAQWSTSSSTSQTSTKAQINTNIPTFDASPLDSAGLIWQAVLGGNGDQQVTLNTVSVSYVNDTQAPDNPSSVTGNDGAWFNRANPQFSWSAPSDNADTGAGEVASGVEGYYVYFGTNGAADPVAQGAFQTGTTYSGSAIPGGDTQPYYLRIKTRDYAQNVSATALDYFRDATVPNNVSSVTGNDGNWFDRANPQFSWSAPTDGAAGGGEVVSGIKGYYVYFGTNGAANPVTDGVFQTGTTFSASPISGSDTQPYYFRIRSIDKALNVSTGTYDAFRDSQAPNNVASVTGNANGGSWYNRANPVFTWVAPSDTADTGNGEVVSGIKGYYVYFGTNPNAVPRTDGTFVATTSYTATPIDTADTQTYYFRIQARDKALNTTSDITGIFDAFRDTTPPNAVASATPTNIGSGYNGWFNQTAPNYTWSAPTDDLPSPNPNNEVSSGIKGYYVYFGTTVGADPAVSGSFQTGTSFTGGSLTSNQTYYLRIKAVDNAFNPSTTLAAATYKFDNVGPTGPVVTVAPAGYTSVNDYTFFWVGTGVSDGAGVGVPTPVTSIQYQFQINGGGWSALTTDTSYHVSDIPNIVEGANTFEIRAFDLLGNAGSIKTATFYYAGSAPTSPENLVASPLTSEGSPSASNSFSFDWDPPSSSVSPIKQYRYSVNKLPTSTNTTITTFTNLTAGPYATQQGKNTFYVVAEDEAGNINYDNPASVDFYTLTPAPAPPTSMQIFDISNRDTQEYAISMKWSEPTKASGFDGYEVYRSVDGSNYVSAGTTKSPVFIDTNLESKTYYFKARSKDNAGQYSADSSVVSIIPTGRYTSAPKLLEAPSVTTKSFSAEVSWVTDRIGSSFIEYGVDQYHLGKSEGGETVGTLDLSTSHTVSLPGLNPETVYYYQAVWVDQDGNRGQSELLSFLTGLRPKISEVKVSNITLSSADVSWVSTTVATSVINYGPTRSFGGSITDVSGSQTTKHTLRIDNLNDATTYYFVVTGTDTDNNALASDEYSFTTLTRPVISEVGHDQEKDAATTTFRFSWITNVPTTTILLYNRSGATTRSQSDSEYSTDHTVTVSGLADLTPYTFQPKGVDRYGNTAVGETISLTTPDDSRPPRVLNMTVEVRSSGVGATQKAQLVVNWETDEPGSSQVEYGPGISSDSYPSRTQEDSVLTTTHVVIVPELEPAKLYHLRAVSRDRAGNAGTSDDTTSITGKVQKSVIDIIITSLQRSLGFLSALPGFGR